MKCGPKARGALRGRKVNAAARRVRLSYFSSSSPPQEKNPDVAGNDLEVSAAIQVAQRLAGSVSGDSAHCFRFPDTSPRRARAGEVIRGGSEPSRVSLPRISARPRAADVAHRRTNVAYAPGSSDPAAFTSSARPRAAVQARKNCRSRTHALTTGLPCSSGPRT